MSKFRTRWGPSVSIFSTKRRHFCQYFSTHVLHVKGQNLGPRSGPLCQIFQKKGRHPFHNSAARAAASKPWALLSNSALLCQSVKCRPAPGPLLQYPAPPGRDGVSTRWRCAQRGGSDLIKLERKGTKKMTTDARSLGVRARCFLFFSSVVALSSRLFARPALRQLIVLETHILHRPRAELPSRQDGELLIWVLWRLDCAHDDVD